MKSGNVWYIFATIVIVLYIFSGQNTNSKSFDKGDSIEISNIVSSQLGEIGSKTLDSISDKIPPTESKKINSPEVLDLVKQKCRVLFNLNSSRGRDCYNTLAVSQEDVSICNGMTPTLRCYSLGCNAIKECYINYALITGENVCSNLPEETKPYLESVEECENLFYARNEICSKNYNINAKNDCLIEKAVEMNNPLLCLNVRNNGFFGEFLITSWNEKNKENSKGAPPQYWSCLQELENSKKIKTQSKNVCENELGLLKNELPYGVWQETIDRCYGCEGYSFKLEEDCPSSNLVDVDIADSYTLGNKDAKITMVEFIDFGSPYDVMFIRNTFPLIKNNYIDNGELKVVFKNLPAESYTYPYYKNRKAHEAAECAGHVGGETMFWKMHDMIFMKQSEIYYVHLRNYAELIGLNMVEFDECFKSGIFNEEIISKIERDEEMAKSLGISKSLGFVINGIEIRGNKPYEEFESVIELAKSLIL